MSPGLPLAYKQIAGELSSKSWPDWSSEFELLLGKKVTERERLVELRTLALANPTPFQQAALDALVDKHKLLDLFSCLSSEGLRRFRIKSTWNINHLDDPNNPRMLDQALRICDDLFGDKVHPMDTDGSEEVCHVAKEKASGRKNLVCKPRSPHATYDKGTLPKTPCGNRGQEDNKDREPSHPSRDQKCSFCGIQGHYTGCSARHPLRNSQTAKISTIIERHPTVNAVHDGRKIRCSVSFQPIPNISLQQRRQGPQEVQIWADTCAEVLTLTDWVFW